MQFGTSLNSKRNTRKTLLANFKKVASQLKGKMCWGIDLGPDIGTAILLYFGKDISINEIPDNVRNFDVRQALGLTDVFIESTWRIDSQVKIICGAWDGHAKKTRAAKILTPLIGQKVLTIKLSEPVYDLEIRFSNGWSLKVFCDATNPEDDADNYSIYLPNEIYTVGRNSKLYKASN